MAEDLISKIQKSLSRDKEYASLETSVLSEDSAVRNVFGLAESAKVPLTLSLSRACEEEHKKAVPILYIVPDVLRAREVAQEFAAYRKSSVPLLHAKPSDLVATGRKSRQEEILLLGALSSFLSGEEDILLVSAPFLMDPLPHLEDLRNRAVKLELGKNYNRESLIAALEKQGYVRSREIDSPAQFAARGEILDIGLFASQLKREEEAVGLRLNFFDTELEAIKIFDLGSQRSIAEIDSVNLAPMREFYFSPERRMELVEQMRLHSQKAIAEARRNAVEESAIEHLRNWTAQDIEYMENGIDFAGLSRWCFLVEEQSQTILDYARELGAKIIIEEPKLTRERLDAAEAAFQEEFSSLLLKQNVLPQSMEQNINPSDVFRALDKYPGQKISLSNLASSGNGLPGGQNYNLQTNVPDKYHGREKFLLQDLKTWQKDGWEILLSVPGERQEKRLREILLEASLTLPIYQSQLNEGVIFPAACLAILASENIFGRRQSTKRRKQREGTPIDFFGDLEPGELVVHDEHGIGRYLGLKILDISGAERDYLHIAYAGDDALYIPVDQLEQIRRYVGGDSQKVKLSKLGSKEWERRKAKVRSSVRKVAIDLLSMYREREKRQGYVFDEDTVWQKEFEEDFPYVETEDQLTAIQEIKADMESPKIMDRLLCGDVGFGKTEVAFRAIFKAVMSGKQTALIVPTTVLAGQHYQSFLERLGESALRVRLLTRFVSEKERKKIMREVKQGMVDVLIGTHSILNKKLEFKDLGLLVVDEEQRFGVEQKELLKERYPLVDVLSLSATPIPRTLHMAISQVRDLSLLQEGPEDRRPVQTYVMEYEPNVLDDAILREISRGGQVFYIFNNIAKMPAKHLELSERLPGAKIRYAHGRMPEQSIEESIADFIKGDFDVLLCTTIVESGIDMPNVNTLIIEHAERMGLAQLYQLRGRVGRSERQAYAYITYPKEVVIKEDASKRLAAIRDFTELGSGLRIAMRDLEVRGAGNFLGGEQSGHMGAVGYELYSRMLEEDIQELRGESKTEAKPSCLIDLDVDAHIPEDYIRDEGQRMDIYRRTLAISSDEDWSDVLDEIVDRFGDPPRAVINLLDVAFVRAKAGIMGIKEISEAGIDILLYLNNLDNNTNAIFSILQKEHYAQRLHFNAGYKPHIIFLEAAVRQDHKAEELRKLFQG